MNITGNSVEECSIRDQKIQTILIHIDKIREALLLADFAKSFLNYRKEKIENAHVKSLDQAIAFLNDYQLFVNKFWQIYGLVKPDRWKNYKLIGVTGLWEQEEMNKIKNLLRSQWMRRPNLLRSGTPKAHESKNGPHSKRGKNNDR